MDVQTIIDAAGGVHQLAGKLGVSRTTVLGWKTDLTIPANRVVQISQTLGLPMIEVLQLSAAAPVKRKKKAVAA